MEMTCFPKGQILGKWVLDTKRGERGKGRRRWGTGYRKQLPGFDNSVYRPQTLQSVHSLPQGPKRMSRGASLEWDGDSAPVCRSEETQRSTFWPRSFMGNSKRMSVGQRIRVI